MTSTSDRPNKRRRLSPSPESEPLPESRLLPYWQDLGQRLIFPLSYDLRNVVHRFLETPFVISETVSSEGPGADFQENVGCRRCGFSGTRTFMVSIEDSAPAVNTVWHLNNETGRSFPCSYKGNLLLLREWMQAFYGYYSGDICRMIFRFAHSFKISFSGDVGDPDRRFDLFSILPKKRGGGFDYLSLSTISRWGGGIVEIPGPAVSTEIDSLELVGEFALTELSGELTDGSTGKIRILDCVLGRLMVNRDAMSVLSAHCSASGNPKLRMKELHLGDMEIPEECRGDLTDEFRHAVQDTLFHAQDLQVLRLNANFALFPLESLKSLSTLEVMHECQVQTLKYLPNLREALLNVGETEDEWKSLGSLLANGRLAKLSARFYVDPPDGLCFRSETLTDLNVRSFLDEETTSFFDVVLAFSGCQNLSHLEVPGIRDMDIFSRPDDELQSSKNYLHLRSAFPKLVSFGVWCLIHEGCEAAGLRDDFRNFALEIDRVEVSLSRVLMPFDFGSLRRIVTYLSVEIVPPSGMTRRDLLGHFLKSFPAQDAEARIQNARLHPFLEITPLTDEEEEAALSLFAESCLNSFAFRAGSFHYDSFVSFSKKRWRA